MKAYVPEGSSNTETLWQTALEEIRPRISGSNFVRWFRPLRPVSLLKDQFVVEAPNLYIKDWFEANFSAVLAETISRLANRPLRVIVQVSSPKPTRPTSSHKGAQTPPPPTPPRQPNFPPQYTFENFVVGPSNQLAQAASLAVTKAPGGRYNPLFIYGGVGLGKTHLLCAIGNTLIRQARPWRIIYTTSEQFTAEYVAHIRTDKADAFRRKYRSECDILLIDDIQFIAGKDRTQEEFFHTFNALYDSGKQIVVTSDRFPHEIPGLEDRLRNRFEWGLIADIQSPEFETRLAIVRKKALQQNLSLPEEVAVFLAENIRSNIRQIEGALVRLAAFASLHAQPVTLPFAQEVLSGLLSAPVQNLQPEEILQEVASFYGLRVTDLTGKRRQRQVAEARQVAMFLTRELLGLSYPQIGQVFGGKNHTTVMAAVKKISELVETEGHFKSIVEALKGRLGPVR